jgi:hypothetical protein
MPDGLGYAKFPQNSAKIVFDGAATAGLAGVWPARASRGEFQCQSERYERKHRPESNVSRLKFNTFRNLRARDSSSMVPSYSSETIMTLVETLRQMVAIAERKNKPDAPWTLNLKEQLRAAEQAQPTAYQQFILGSHELGPEGDDKE